MNAPQWNGDDTRDFDHREPVRLCPICEADLTVEDHMPPCIERRCAEDEDCSHACVPCFLATGDTRCDQHCPHADVTKYALTRTLDTINAILDQGGH